MARVGRPFDKLRRRPAPDLRGSEALQDQARLVVVTPRYWRTRLRAIACGVVVVGELVERSVSGVGPVRLIE